MRRENAYRVYISECLRMISASEAYGKGKEYMNITLEEMINPKPEETTEVKVDDRPASVIAADMWARMNKNTRGGDNNG